MPHGHFQWNELGTIDVERAKAMYAEVAGWTYDHSVMNNGNSYWIALDGDKPVCGMFEMPDDMAQNLPEHWICYLTVDDVDSAVRTAERHGASLMREIFDVASVDRLAIVRQPEGAMIGFMTPETTA